MARPNARMSTIQKKRPMMQSMTRCLTALLVLVSGVLAAQEAGYFNHQYLQPILINPAAAGFNGDHQFLAGYRHRWSGFPGAPRTFTGLYHGEVADRLGLGVQLLSDRIGEANQTGANLALAYHIKTDRAIVSVGLSAGMQQFRITGTNDDPLIDPNDELLNEAIDGYMLFDGGAGVYAEIDSAWIFGLSFPNLIKNRISEINGDVNVPDLDEFGFAAMLGYRWYVQSSNFYIEPSVTIKDLRYSPFLVDANLKFSFLDEQLVGGVGYTFGDNSRAALLLGTRIDDLRVYYSYDVSLGDFQTFNNGSHEITLVLRLPKRGTRQAGS